uniref:10 kDa heat shock protein, mitochondrial n=1 Tax=Steinernema glaseri TaxID=37863 RepID=A0A1I7YDX1_9BILA
MFRASGSVLRTIARGYSQNAAVKGFTPLFDRVLVERFAPEVKTKGGIMLPEKSQGKVLEAIVVACGPGARAENGSTIPLTVQVGDRVLLPEYGGTKVNMDNKDYVLFREADIMGKFD